MKRREWKQLDRSRWYHRHIGSAGSSGRGYLKTCRSCGERIYLKAGLDGEWRPYESWLYGTVEEGEWKLHDCER
ncbi:MAG: hypothetical protein GX547_06810 [Phycisphaerae bacterium]|nr:hypothetical protein [Phycisphaerae bacterium]